MKQRKVLTGCFSLVVCSLLFTHCTSKNTDLYDPTAVAQNEGMKQHEQFSDAFKKEFGEPAATVDWGFGASTTRGAVAVSNRAPERSNEEIFGLSYAEIEALSESDQCAYLKQLGDELVNMPVDKLKAFGFKRLIAEDLTLTEQSDFDYNDIVFDARRVETSGVDGFATFYIIARATGAYKKIYVGREEDEGRFEIHGLFGVPQQTFVNTVAKEQPKVHGAYWDKDHDPIFTVLRVKKTGAAEPTLIDIEIFAEDNVLPLTAKRGEPAEKMCVDTDFSWVTERVKMRAWYPSFEHYVTGDMQSETSWWHPTYWSNEQPNLDSSTGIPNDSEAQANPSVESTTTNVPNMQVSVETINGKKVIRLDVTGIKNESDSKYLNLVGTDSEHQNTWIEADGTPKGILIDNNVETSDNNIKVDVVFTVDNSGSMSEEADALARDIMAWASQLSKASLDVRFGVVGYGGAVGSQKATLVSNWGVCGALNLTTYSELNSFLNNRGYSGVGRTKGYAGGDANTLKSLAADTKYSSAGGECGVQAIRFADENFSFRKGANRIYVNFTDDANYTGGNTGISVSYIQSEANWPSYKGTIHSVISNTKAYVTTCANKISTAELSWLISDYTGGTVLFVSSSFQGVTLSSLPVTGALENSSVIRMNAGNLIDGKDHDIHVTVKSEDGRIVADKTFTINVSE